MQQHWELLQIYIFSRVEISMQPDQAIDQTLRLATACGLRELLYS